MRIRSRAPCSCVGACTKGLMYESQYLSTIRALYLCVRLYGANPQELYTVCWCSPTRALYFCVRLYGASRNGVCAVRTHKGFIQCAGARPPELCTQCICARAGTCANERACTSVRCETTRALYIVLVLAHEGFAPSAYVLVRAHMQMSLCTRTCTSIRYKLTRSLCFCATGCPDELLYGNLYVCTVRAHNGLMQCASKLVSRNEVFVWDQYACVSYAKPAVEMDEVYKYLAVDIYCLCTSSGTYPYLRGGRKTRTRGSTIREN